MLDMNKKVKYGTCRSLFALFINNIKRDTKRRRHHYREPSRIPLRALKKGLKRRNRIFLRKYVLKTVPKSSFLYQIIKVASLRKTVLCNSRKAMENCTSKYLASKKERTYKNVNHEMTHVSIKESGDIETNPYPRVIALRGLFDPCVISNKEAHIINGNIFISKATNSKTSSISELSQQGTNARRHFINYCLTHSGKFSCAVDCFLELSVAIFKDSLRDIERNEFFQTLFDACLQLENHDVQTEMAVVREPVWVYLRQHCNSFTAMSADAVFSDIFRLDTVGMMTEELKSLFLIQQSNQSVCSSCNNAIIKNTAIFVLYINSPNLLHNGLENYVSEAILPNSSALYCDLCQEHSGDLSMLQHFVILPRFLTMELSSNYINQIFFPLTMDVLGQNYVLKGMVRCLSSHFTVAIKDDARWIYVDDMCVSVRIYTSFQHLLSSHSNGWFFAIYEKSLIRDNNGIQKNAVACKTVQQSCNNVFVGTLPKDVPIIKTTNNETITKSSAIALYAICFSVIKPCSYWKSDTLDALVEYGSAFFTETIKNQTSSSELPQNVNIYGANINVKVVTSNKGILVCNSFFSKLALERLMLQNGTKSSGFLLQFPSLCLSCVFHKTSKNVTFYLISLNKIQGLGVHRISDKNYLVERVCQSVTNTAKSNEIQYFFQSVLCTCELNKGEKQKIMKCHKSAKCKKEIAIKRRKSYSQFEPARKKICLDKRRECYNNEKQKVLIARTEKYKSMDPNEKQNMLTHRAEKYKSMDAHEKEQLLAKTRETYHNMKSEEKEKWLEKIRRVARNTEERKAISDNDLDFCIASFQKAVREGPYYICSVCNRTLYRKTVIELKKIKYVKQHLFTGKMSFDKKEYICKTCHSKLLKEQVPCQAVYNKLMVDETPPELECLEKLEQILISQRIVFEKIVIMPKGQQRKIKGAICNVPVECDHTCNVLPRPPESSGIIMLKLKRKLDFRGHVYFQAVRPAVILNALNWLRINNPLYSCITVNIENIDINLREMQLRADSDSADGEESPIIQVSCEQTATNDQSEEERNDPLNEFRAATSETCLQSVLPDYPVNVDKNTRLKSHGNEIFNIAPGENKHPVSFMTDKNCEELAFPVLFPKGRFGYTVERPVNLSPTKYFNARLLHYSGKFAMNPEYLFFAQFIIEQKKVSDSIAIALTKVHGQSLTASHLRSNVQNFQNLIFQDQAYLFLRQIPGTPPYWQKFMFEVIAMVKQLGIPTWFMTLSCADLRWPELFQIIGKIQGLNLTDEVIEGLSYNERCSMLNSNPVVVAKHFQYRVETFFTEVLLSKANPIGKIVYYALRIEFQMRGSPHLHALIWTSDCPKLTNETKEDYIKYIDNHVQAYLPDKQKDSQLFTLVQTYQKHNHSKSCRKYTNVPCRFNFGQFFTKRTVVAEPLSEKLDEELKRDILTRRNEILCLVKEEINKILNPNKPQYNPKTTEEKLLSSLGVTEEQYYWALSISGDSDFDLHLKRPLDSCFINNYFVAGIKGFRANVDLQPVFNHYKCITYVCSYFTKDETECSQAIANAAKEAKTSNLAIKDSLRKIGAAFLSTREVSSQECVYRCMPELWLRKVFPKTVFVSTDLPENRIRVAKSKIELDELHEDSTDIYKSNIIERYSIRPNKNPIIDNLCLAEFAAYYYKEYKNDCVTSDAQPEILTDDVIESHVQFNTNADVINYLPSKIRLINTNEVMKCRKTKAVLRYHRPNKVKEPEKYFHHLLMLYYPWRNEDSLIGNEQTYASRFYEPKVQAIVEQKRTIFEPEADAITEALEALRNSEVNNFSHSFDSFNDQENEDLQLDMQSNVEIDDESFNEQIISHLSSNSNSDKVSTNATITSYVQPREISDDLLREHIRSLNEKQRIAYDSVLRWCRNKVKNLRSLKPYDINPIYLFMTGGAGSGKSHVINTIYQTAIKTFRQTTSNPDLPTVLLMAPTGVSAIHIGGTTIHSALAIPKETGDNLPAMSDQKKTQMRLTLSELKLIIIDEISMVSNITLLHIHQRLKDIFGSSSSKLFAGISIIAVGDLYQLPPIRRKPIFEKFNNECFNLCHPWHVFTMIELTDIMRQKNDRQFAEILNRFRTASQTEEDLNCINSRVLVPSTNNYPLNALHIWAENDPVNEHNNKQLLQLSTPLFVLRATDQYPSNVTKQDIDKVLSRGRSETGGLEFEVKIKEGARVMLTTNINIADRLINGQMGTVVKIDVNKKTQKPTVVYIKFDDNEAGRTLIQNSSSIFARENAVVPIEQVLSKIKVRPGKPSSPEVQRIQFPISLAWACTIHKVQGLTLRNVVISFHLNKQRSFNYGQVYVALSRSTSLQGLHILGEINTKHIKADPRVHNEYDRLRSFKLVDLKDITHSNKRKIEDNNLVVTLCLLNIRSLRKHSSDVKCDVNLLKNDLIAFTETQLLPNDNDSDIIDNLSPFSLYRYDHNSDKYSSLAICIKKKFHVTNQEYYPTLNAVRFMFTFNNHRSHVNISLLLIYRKNNSNILDLINGIDYLVRSNPIDIILGDFNINYFSSNDMEVLSSLMQSLDYLQIVAMPTFISGSLLDHVYIRQANKLDIDSSVINVYYSDHDAIKITIRI